MVACSFRLRGACCAAMIFAVVSDTTLLVVVVILSSNGNPKFSLLDADGCVSLDLTPGVDSAFAIVDETLFVFDLTVPMEDKILDLIDPDDLVEVVEVAFLDLEEIADVPCSSNFTVLVVETVSDDDSTIFSAFGKDGMVAIVGSTAFLFFGFSPTSRDRLASSVLAVFFTTAVEDT